MGLHVHYLAPPFISDLNALSIVLITVTMLKTGLQYFSSTYAQIANGF